jgi:hypothetical protein
MFYAGGEWRFWVETETPGQFIEIHGWPAESFYWGDKGAEPADFGLPFLEFVAQHANLWSVRHAFSGIQDDLFNLSASLHKLDLIHAAGGHGASRLAATEVEYIMLLCRSIFDLLQEVVAGIWDTISLIGPDGQVDPTANKRQLAKTFSDMALKAKDVRPAQELTKKFGLPSTIADCYARHAPVFLKIRKFRDDIVHRGQNVRTIFHTETGFAIQRRLGPFQLDIWRSDEIGENDIAPLLPVLGLLIHGTLVACNDFAHTLASCIRFPPPMVPNLVLLMRGYFNAGLLTVLEDAEARVGEGLVLIKPEG